MKKDTLFHTNIFICAIIVIGFIITSLVSYHSNRGVFIQDMEYISALTSEGVSHQIDSIFEKPINISLTMANDSLLRELLNEESADPDNGAYVEAVQTYLDTYRKKYDYDSVFLASAKTDRYYYFNGVDRILEKNDPENVWYYKMLESDEDYRINIDNDQVATANNEIAIFINARIRDGAGNTMGIIGVGFHVGYLQEIFGNYERNFNIKAYLVDEEGKIEISTDRSGYENTNLFEICAYPDLKDQILDSTADQESLWYGEGHSRGHIVTRYIPNLQWHLIIENDISSLERELNRQLAVGVLVIFLVVVIVLITITGIIRKYNIQIVRLTIDAEKKHRTLFQVESEKMYKNIYEVDVTHNRAASEATAEYFESLGVPPDTPFDQALHIIARTQIKEEYRDGYLATFSPDHVLEAFRGGIESLHYDFLFSEDGCRSYYWMRITARIFYWDEDGSVRMLAFHQNVDEEKERERGLIEKMEEDSLTGLYNKASTQEYIRRRLADQPNRTYAFFILDIDDFKKVNDTYGHAVGDQVIAGFAARLKGQFRESDIVGRIGGDEFAVFVPAPSEDWVQTKGESLIQALHYEFSEETCSCTISTSVGAAVSPKSGSDFETLYRNADTALYDAKEIGKNRFVIYEK